MSAPKVLVVFSSIFGANAALAEQCQAVLEEAGADVRVRGVPQLVLGQYEVASAKAHPKASAEDLEWADGYLLTSPVHTGALSASIKAFVDSEHDGAIAGKYQDKTFTSMATGELPHSGQESVVKQLNSIGDAWGCVVVAPSTANPELNNSDGNAFGLSFTLVKGKLPEGIEPALSQHLNRFVKITEAVAAARPSIQEGHVPSASGSIVSETADASAPRHAIGSALS